MSTSSVNLLLLGLGFLSVECQILDRGLENGRLRSFPATVFLSPRERILLVQGCLCLLLRLLCKTGKVRSLWKVFQIFSRLIFFYSGRGRRGSFSFLQNS